MGTIATKLTQEQKDKINCIENINALYLVYLNRRLKTKEFDDLYDLPLNKLQRALCNVKDHLEREQSIKNLTDACNEDY